MNKLLLILLLTSYIFTQNIIAKELTPIIYSALGDKIYNNINNISDLVNIKEYKVYEDEIITYTKEVEATKAMGFAIEEGDKSIDRSKYLNKLRKLSKTNDSFVQKVQSNFKFAIKNKDNTLFVNSVDSGLLDVNRYAKEIKKYYIVHEDEIDNYGSVLGKIVSTYGRKVKKQKKYRAPTKQDIQDAKMKRIRQKDKLKQEEVQKSLEDELNKKKANIRKIQKEELESTSK